MLFILTFILGWFFMTAVMSALDHLVDLRKSIDKTQHKLDVILMESELRRNRRKWDE